MRQSPNPRRSRGRGPRKPHMAPRGQNFDNNAPEMRVRGNAYQVLEKYLALARDANSAGDRIAAENYLQHAEHYYRVINAAGEQNGRRQGGRGEGNGAEPGPRRGADGGEAGDPGQAAGTADEDEQP